MENFPSQRSIQNSDMIPLGNINISKLVQQSEKYYVAQRKFFRDSILSQEIIENQNLSEQPISKFQEFQEMEHQYKNQNQQMQQELTLQQLAQYEQLSITDRKLPHPQQQNDQVMQQSQMQMTGNQLRSSKKSIDNDEISVSKQSQLLTSTGKTVNHKRGQSLNCNSNKKVNEISYILNNRGLTKFPSYYTFNKETLKILELQNNKLKIFPIEIFQLKNLTTLRMDSNFLKEIPKELFSRLKLEILSFKNNLISIIPNEIILQRDSLIYLDVGFNKINQLNSAIMKLKKLRSLHINNNEIQYLSLQLSNLENLQDFSLDWFLYTKPPMPLRTVNKEVIYKLFQFLNNKKNYILILKEQFKMKQQQDYNMQQQQQQQQIRSPQISIGNQKNLDYIYQQQQQAENENRNFPLQKKDTGVLSSYGSQYMINQPPNFQPSSVQQHSNQPQSQYYNQQYQQQPFSIVSKNNIQSNNNACFQHQDSISSNNNKDQSSQILSQSTTLDLDKALITMNFQEFMDLFSSDIFDINERNSQGQTLLHRASENEDISSLQCLLQLNSALIDAVDKQNVSALSLAINSEKYFSSKSLLQHPGVQLNSGAGFYGSVLNQAVLKNNFYLVQDIINKGVDVRVPDNDGNTSLHYLMAAFNKDTKFSEKVSTLLLQRGADPNQENLEKWTPLHLAVRKNQYLAIKFVMKYNMSVRQSEKSNSVSNSINQSCTLSQQQQQKQLQKPIFSINKYGGKEKQTSLHIAAMNGFFEIIQLLLDNGADIFKRNIYNQLPIDQCVKDLLPYKLLKLYHHLKLKQFHRQTKKLVFEESYNTSAQIIGYCMNSTGTHQTNNNLKSMVTTSNNNNLVDVNYSINQRSLETLNNLTEGFYNNNMANNNCLPDNANFFPQDDIPFESKLQPMNQSRGSVKIQNSHRYFQSDKNSVNNKNNNKNGSNHNMKMYINNDDANENEDNSDYDDQYAMDNKQNDSIDENEFNVTDMDENKSFQDIWESKTNAITRKMICGPNNIQKIDNFLNQFRTPIKAQNYFKNENNNNNVGTQIASQGKNNNGNQQLKKLSSAPPKQLDLDELQYNPNQRISQQQIENTKQIKRQISQFKNFFQSKIIKYQKDILNPQFDFFEKYNNVINLQKLHIELHLLLRDYNNKCKQFESSQLQFYFLEQMESPTNYDAIKEDFILQHFKSCLSQLIDNDIKRQNQKTQLLSQLQIQQDLLLKQFQNQHKSQLFLSNGSIDPLSINIEKLEDRVQEEQFKSQIILQDIQNNQIENWNVLIRQHLYFILGDQLLITALDILRKCVNKEQPIASLEACESYVKIKNQLYKNTKTNHDYMKQGNNQKQQQQQFTKPVQNFQKNLKIENNQTIKQQNQINENKYNYPKAISSLTIQSQTIQTEQSIIENSQILQDQRLNNCKNYQQKLN